MIELLVSLTIGSLIFSLMLNLYITTKQHYDLYLSQYELQKTAGLAARILKDDVHLAGYIGCPKLTNDLVTSSDPNDKMTTDNKLIISADSIITRHAGTDMVTLSSPLQNANQIEIDKSLNIKKGDVLLISNCQSADIFRVNAVIQLEKKQIIFTDQPLQHDYGKDAEVSHMLRNQYFIKKTQRKDMTGKMIYALFRRNIRGETEEIVSGVHKMIIEDGRRDFRSGIIIHLTIVASPFEKQWPIYIAS